jgi:hypothetical protein
MHEDSSMATSLLISCLDRSYLIRLNNNKKKGSVVIITVTSYWAFFLELHHDELNVHPGRKIHAPCTYFHCLSVARSIIQLIACRRTTCTNNESSKLDLSNLSYYQIRTNRHIQYTDAHGQTRQNIQFKSHVAQNVTLGGNKENLIPTSSSALAIFFQLQVAIKTKFGQ